VRRPRILLVPTLTELEWRIKPNLEEWAEVASYDAPGIGEEAPPTAYTREAVAERGLLELERCGWERCVLVGDEFGTAVAVRIAAARPEAVQALALGHGSLSLRSTGERPPLNHEVLAAFRRVARTDYRSHVRALSQITQHAYDDEFADRYLERVPQQAAGAYELAASEDEEMEGAIRSLQVPLLLVEHKGCLLYTREGFEDALAAFPDAETASLEVKPSANPEFSGIIRQFCAKVEAAETRAG
jgi:pimeloyl-ACP methyl ester carboxylesterase